MTVARLGQGRRWRGDERTALSDRQVAELSWRASLKGTFHVDETGRMCHNVNEQCRRSLGRGEDSSVVEFETALVWRHRMDD